MASTRRLPWLLASVLLTPALGANVTCDFACGASGPMYGVSLNGAALFASPPAHLYVFTQGAWQSDFVLVRSQPVAGVDAIGAFSGLACTYAFASAPRTAVVTLSAFNYPSLTSTPTSTAVRFTTSFPGGLLGTAHASLHQDDSDSATVSTIALFPAFTASIPAGQPSNILTWSDSFMQPSYTFSDGLGMAGGPMLFYGEDVSASAVMLSPLDQFLSSAIGNEVAPATLCNATAPGGAGCWAAGVSSTFTSLPPGFESSWILLGEEGVTPLVAAYRDLLLSYYASTSTKLADVSISGLSYTTDNGGQLTFGCPGQVLDKCLLQEGAYLKQIGAPIQMLSFQNAPMVARGESAPWCVSEFVPNPNKVPMGIQAFQQALGLPLQLYAPYLCNNSYYAQNFTLLQSNTSLPGCGSFSFLDPAPADSRRYFDFLMDLVVDYGATLFEPDFLHQNHLCVDEYIGTIGAAEAFLGGMADAALARGIAIQFCFATPHVMLWTLTAPAITNARVSLDFYYGNSWNIGSSSLMAWASNSAPSKDTLWSSDNGAQATTRGGCDRTGCPPDHSNSSAVMHTMLAVLSTGPVGYSDAPNETDITLVMRTCDAAGNLLQPSRPIVAVDSTHDVTGAAPAGFVLLTHTSTYGMTSPSMYFLVSHHLTSPFAVRGLDMWPRLTSGSVYAVANWTALRTQCSNNSAPACAGLALQTAPATLDGAFTTLGTSADKFQALLTLVAPTCGSGATALFGEVEKVATISVQRFVTMSCDAASSSIAFSMLGQPGETVRIGYLAAGTIRFFTWTFTSGGPPSTVSCSVSNSSGGCAAAASPDVMVAPTAVALPRIGSGMEAVNGARARASTPVKTALTGSLRGQLPDQLVDYLDVLHRNVSTLNVTAARMAAARRGDDAASDPMLQTLYDMLAAALEQLDPVQLSQDCMAASLTYEYSLRIMPSRAPQREVWDALRLGPDCGVTPPPSAAELGLPPAWPPQAHDLLLSGAAAPTFYVSPSGDDVNGDGSEGNPFRTLARGVNATRAARAPGTGPASIILRAGLHVLGQTLQLDARDAQLSIVNFPGESAFVSGGAPISNGPLTWTALNVSNVSNLYSTQLSSPPQYLTSLVTVNATDASPTKRLYRAQYPNFNPEMHLTAACGGGARAAATPECIRDAIASPFIRETARRIVAAGGHPWLAAGGNPHGLRDPLVLDWVPPPHFPTPQMVFRDLFGEGLKNDSTMMGYNQYSVGRGGACGLWTNPWPESSSLGWDYHCGNISAGGWENVDELMYSIGQLNLPYAAIINTTVYPNSATWAPNVDPSQRENGAAVVWSWHTQGWFLNSFFVTGVSSINSSATYLNMTEDNVYPLGGWQGGRHWETQGSFDNGGPGGALLSGGWWISNLFQELDSFDEFYYDVVNNTLYVFWNASDTEGGNPYSPPPSNVTLMAPQLEVFFNLSGTSDVTITGLGFRDQRNTMMEPWVVPSGGDWGLRPAGAINVWDCERITISNVLFTRTDSNAVFLGGYNRNVSVLDSEFVWLGMNAVASLGLTDFEDGTAGQQPWGTVMSGLFVHEIALVEKQSSAYFSGRTALARMETSIMFNGPRAMINVNDNYGGGSNYTQNVLFNTCRESGDHGNMNSWSRMPMSDNLTGFTSFMNQQLSETSLSFGIGNYGTSQVFDNDDGSNHFYTHHNFWYTSDGFKGDYGPHDSIFADNVVVVRPYDGQNCLNSANYVPGHASAFYNNTCVIMGARSPSGVDVAVTGAGGWCNPNSGNGLMSLFNNSYYTQHGNASVACGSSSYGTTIAAYRSANPGFEVNSAASTLPTPDQVIQWGRDVLGI